MQKVAPLRTIQQGKVQLEPESGLLSVSVALISTSISFVTANIAFVRASEGFTQFRQVRTEFAFSPPTHHTLLIAIMIIGGAIAVQSRQWIVPIGLALMLSVFCQDVYGYSGPDYLFRGVHPLIDYKGVLTGAALLANAIILIGWICVSKRLYNQDQKQPK